MAVNYGCMVFLKCCGYLWCVFFCVFVGGFVVCCFMVFLLWGFWCSVNMVNVLCCFFSVNLYIGVLTMLVH